MGKDDMMEREFKDSGIEWIGRIPKEWKTVPFKAYFSTGKGLSFTKADLTPSGKAVVSYGQIHSKQNTGTRLDDFLIRFIPDSLTENGEFSRMNKGDFIFADISEDLEGCGNSVYVDRETELYAGYHSVTAKSKVQQANKYFAYYFLTPCWRSQVRSRVTGIKVFSISQSIINQTSIIVPPFTEQQRIADYLDKKCGEIDELIALQEQMIAQLTDYKQSVITEAVTKGLNPDAELVPSGIDWIGDVPKHWGTPSISYLASISSGSTPDRNHPEYWNDGVINWIKTGELQNNKITDSEEKVTEYALNKTSIKLYPQNTILIAMYGQGKTRGMTALLDVPSTTNQACAALSTFNKSINYLYLWKCLIAAYNAIRDMAVGTGQPNLNIDLISKFVIPLPPYEEQMNIVEYIDHIVPKIDSLIAIKLQKIETLKDYKKSVIYEAVTGKMSIGETP